MGVDTREFLARQRKRATGAILGHIERAPYYSQLDSRQKDELREKVLSAMSAYHDSVLDVIATLDGGGGIHNESALDLLQQLHEHLVAPRRERPFATADGG